jgi:hypothetical protein
MNDSFAESRASLRAALGVANSDGSSSEWMPRSKIMRLVLNPDNRPVFLAAVTLATLAFPRLKSAGLLYPLAARVAKAGRHISKLRFHR